MGRRNSGERSGAATSAAVFGELLREHREGAGLSQEKLASSIPCDRSLVAKVESGTRVPQHSFVVRCDELLGTGGILTRLWSRIDWYPPAEHPDWFKRRAGMDAEAVAIREYECHVVHGLLQTEDYARALFARFEDEADVIEQRVSARMSRQSRFLRPDGPLLTVILHEGLLRTVVGSAAVMREQCARLLVAGTQPNIRIQVAPAGNPALRLPDTSMSLITLPDRHEWVYSESLDLGHFTDNPALITRHTRTYDVLRADALSAPESAALITEVMEGYGHHGLHPPGHGHVAQEQLQRRQRRQLHRVRPRFPRRRPGA